MFFLKNAFVFYNTELRFCVYIIRMLYVGHAYTSIATRSDRRVAIVKYTHDSRQIHV